jgi:hypothetical protein
MFNNTPSTKELIGKDLDIFIDIQSIYKDILDSEFMGSDNKTLSINILNMAAHYRHYFRNQLKSFVRVYIVDSKENFTGNLVKMSNNEKDLFKPIEVLCKYFPDIYYIRRTGYNPCCVIYELIKSQSSIYRGKLVISNDIYSYQLPNIFSSTYLLHIAIKHKKLVSMANSIDAQFKNTSPTSDLSPQLIPILMAFNKCEAIGLPLLYSYKTALKLLRQSINKGVFVNACNSPFEAVDCVLGINGFYARWVTSDLITKSLSYINSPEILDTTWTVKRQIDFQELASIIDSRVNNVIFEEILNYIYLME